MNLSYAYIDGVRTRVLLDDGSQINSVTPAYAREHDMVIGLLQELAGDLSGNLIQGMGGCWTGTLGYVVFCIQIEGMKSYDEEQVALVMADETKFGHRVLIILGTPTIHRVVRSMKESEMENALPEWERIRVAYEATNQLFSYRATCDAEEKKLNSTQYPTNTKINPIDIDERIYLTKPVQVPRRRILMMMPICQSVCMSFGRTLSCMMAAGRRTSSCRMVQAALFTMPTSACGSSSGCESSARGRGDAGVYEVTVRRRR